MQKKVPMRMCVACRNMKPKKELLRIVKNEDAQAQMDKTGRMPGRGAYVCASKACVSKAAKQKQLERALECSVSKELLEEIEARIALLEENETK